MKRTLEFLLIGLIAGGLMTGCPKKDDETEEPSTAEQPEPEPEPEPDPEPEPETAAQLEINEENYQKALFEVSCVKAHVDDTEKQKAIITEVHARYGFDEESYAAAGEAMEGKADVKAALEKKMEDCTEEMALGFAKASDDDGEEEETKDDDDKKKVAKKWKSGSYVDGRITGGGLAKGVIKLRVTNEGKLMGSFQGKREGKGFSIPLKGEMSKDGSFQAAGSRGPNNARAVGRYGNGALKGKIRGAVHKKKLMTAFHAK